MLLNGAEILLECLKEQMINTVFGYPGGAVIPFYDALYDQQDHFTHIRTAHEQSAIHAADGYARMTGKVGVSVVTSGPGATNTITGIANAYLDSIPMVVITGQVASSLLGRDSFQEIDITGVTISITKHNYLITDINKLAETVRTAFKVANTGRKGPVLLDITKDVLLAKTEYTPKEIDNSNDLASNIDTDLLNEVARLINESKRPLICAGGGVKTSGASKELIEIAELTDIPVANTLMGLGSIPRTHKLSLGMIGMHGLEYANRAVIDSDLIVAIGSRFSDRLIGKADQFAKNAKVIHIDIDKTEIKKNYNSNISINADVKIVLKELRVYLTHQNRFEWHKQIAGLRVNKIKEDFNPSNVLKAINSKLPNINVVTDVGQHQMWTAQNWSFSNEKSFITSGGLGTMGFGIGAAIGSQVGSGKRVLLITGDGSFNMTNNELYTISRYNLPITIVIMNNNALGMVRQWQKMFFNERYAETTNTSHLDYVKLADAYGIEGYRAEDMLQLNSVMEKIKGINNRPVLLECIISSNENVYPIVPPGKSILNMITE